jgi:hypothetical protein
MRYIWLKDAIEIIILFIYCLFMCWLNSLIASYKENTNNNKTVKVKVHPRTGHKGPEG